ncbi:hypothetical protein L914_00647 [Phytophthora nicotianae]|uniref:CCHC-type domain-containing protein n=1 Tax=Phytophthora nicotianae TaxID=4792 RepID=W2P6R7_PHYNI|nr:hypothetical protein L914_00647 [Phytophthora nicotianae]
MKKYEAYCHQLFVLETAFFRPFHMPVGACVEDERRRRIALFGICKSLDDITEEDWIDYFWDWRSLPSTTCKNYVRWEPRTNTKSTPAVKQLVKKSGPPYAKAAPTKAAPAARRKRTCLKCGSEEHRVKDCPRVAAGEAEQLLRLCREKRVSTAAAPATPVHHVKALQLNEVPLPHGSGCLARLENVLDLGNVLLDSGSDVNVASRGLVKEPEARGVKVQEETCAPCADDGGPAGTAQRQTLVLSRPVMERLCYSVDAILAQACDTSLE